MATLLVHDLLGARTFELRQREVRVGRDLDCDLRLTDTSISRSHCLLRQSPEGWEIQDLQSSNGVLVNDQPVATARLQAGDCITLGQVRLTFQGEP